MKRTIKSSGVNIISKLSEPPNAAKILVDVLEGNYKKPVTSNILPVKEFKELQKSGALKVKSPHGRRSPKSETLGKMELLLKQEKIYFIREFTFAPKRRFRFDIYIPDIFTGIEYNGVMGGKSRHTTITGYTRDNTKLNLAQVLGYKVLNYTILNYGEMIGDVKKLLNLK